jgi:hypothetical protein
MPFRVFLWYATLTLSIITSAKKRGTPDWEPDYEPDRPPSISFCKIGIAGCRLRFE